MSLPKSCRHVPLALGVVGVIAASMSGCGGGGATSTAPPAPTRGACAVNTPHNDGRARWTVLIYMNSANNLEPDSFLNVSQMASVGSDSNVNIVVQWKQIPAARVNNPTGDNTPSFVGTHRFLIHQHSAADVSAIASHNTSSMMTPIASGGDLLADPTTNKLDPNDAAFTSDMGNPATFTNFIQWGTAAYPADNMAVLIWNHGSGWRPVPNCFSGSALGKKTLLAPPNRRAVCQDDGDASEIETWQLPSCFAASAVPLDMIMIDASLEQMIEVAYQLKSSARVVVGSEESPPASGYPYDKWLADLKASGKNPCDVGTEIITEFASEYAGQTNITQSYLDMSKMAGVGTALDNLGSALLVHITDQASVIANARDSAIHFGFGESLYTGFVDLYNFADILSKTTPRTDLQTAANNLKTALAGTSGAVLQKAFGASDESAAGGLSVYIPSPGQLTGSSECANFPFPTQGDYSQLALATAAPHWTKFLTSMTQ